MPAGRSKRTSPYTSSSDDPCQPFPGSLLVRIALPPQAHFSLDKTPRTAVGRSVVKCIHRSRVRPSV